MISFSSRQLKKRRGQEIQRGEKNPVFIVAGEQPGLDRAYPLITNFHETIEVENQEGRDAALKRLFQTQRRAR